MTPRTPLADGLPRSSTSGVAPLGIAALLLAACPGPSARPSHVAPTFPSSTHRQEEPPSDRLPSGVRPVHYSLELTITPEQEDFSGEVAIRATLDARRDTLWLHALGLEIGVATVTPSGGRPVSARSSAADAHGLMALRLAAAVGPGEVTIRLAYRGRVSPDPTGLYRMEDEADAYVFTLFEPDRARRAFPCFDEPGFKAPFDVALVVRREHEAIASTAPVEVTSLPHGMKRVRFATTAPLPTYLLAWAVGPLEVVPSAPIPPNEVRARPLPLRGVVARGRGAVVLATALAETAKIIDWLERYLGIEYPFDKLDLLAVPRLPANGMENAGTVTVREDIMLVDEATVSTEERRDLLTVLAHELAHQWFGDIVTAPWWDDVWLQEGLASWLEARIVDARSPRLHAEVAQLERIHSAMLKESFLNTRPLGAPIRRSDEALARFDAITYAKGAAVLGMLEGWLGARTFQQGLQRYLRRYRFASAGVAELVGVMSEASGRDLASPFRAFVDHPGVPRIDAGVECDASGGRLRLRALPTGGTAPMAWPWQVPVCARWGTGSGVSEGCALVPREGSALELGPRCPDWVVPNAGGSGYYQWSLATTDLRSLMNAGWPHLTARERLSTAQSLETTLVLDDGRGDDVRAALAIVAGDTDPSVVAAALELVRFAQQRLARPLDSRRPDPVAHLGTQLFVPVHRRLGWEPASGAREDPETVRLRTSVLEFLAFGARDTTVRRMALRRGRPAEIVAIALALEMEQARAQEDLDRFTTRLFASTEYEPRQQMLRALGRAPLALLERVHALVNDERLSPWEAGILLRSLMESGATREQTWRWIASDLEAIEARVGPSNLALLPRSLCDEASARQVRVLEPRLSRDPVIARLLPRAQASIDLCVARARALQPALARMFHAR